MRVGEFVVVLAEAYAVAGVVFGVLFVPRAVARMDPGLAQAPVTVRLLILPGVAAFWPLFALRWAKGTHPPTERNPHRDQLTRTATPLTDSGVKAS
jgi:hypothetical protein